MSTPGTTGIRILLIEDSDIDVELLERELKRGGIEYVSHRVQTGDEFERGIAEFQPEIIFADYMLPTFDGAQALALARERCPDVPVILVSGAVGEETAVDLLKNGATDIVLKDRLGRLVPAVHRAFREVAERDARRKAEADLRALNEQLEQRVADRTRELREKNQIVEEDLRMARELQVALLPHRFPTVPPNVLEAASAVRFFSVFCPATAVSGDFFNVVPVSDVAVGVFICDVMGHGVRAALVSAMMRALEEQLGESAGDPGGLLTAINRALCAILRQSGMTLFATACYIIVDVAASRVSFASAGHPSPLLVRSALREVVPIVARDDAGPAMGLFEDAQYVTREGPVAAGDLILLFTDGLFEVENAEAEEFGERRLRESILARCGEPSAQIVSDLYSEIEQFAGGRAFSDDVCLVGVEIADLERAAGTREAKSRVGRAPAHARNSSIG